MLSRVLVPHDGSATSASILAHVRRLVTDSDAEVTLLRVVEPDDETAARVEAASHDLHAAAQALTHEGLKASSRVTEGDPAAAILEVAQELKPDLLAMSTHGRSGVSRLLRGSVAERVLRHSPVPVLLCNPHTTELPAFARILVALDGSPESEACLPLVQELAQREGSTVVLFTVESAIYSDSPHAPDADSVWTEEHLQQRLKVLDHARDQLHAAGISAERQATHGAPAHEILLAADKVDLVVLATHGRSGPSRWWFGSVAESVARSCTRPLLVVRTHTPGS